MSGGKMLGALVFNTLAGCFLIMVIAGQDAAAPQPQGAPPKAASATPAARVRALPEGARITPRQTRAEAPQPILRPSPEHNGAAQPTQHRAALWQVATDRLNLRAEPSTAAPVLARLSRGDRLRLLSDSSAEWVRVHVEDGEAEGWVATRLLRAAP